MRTRREDWKNPSITPSVKVNNGSFPRENAYCEVPGKLKKTNSADISDIRNKPHTALCAEELDTILELNHKPHVIE